jgi:dimethylhistidine N-methyltransferase
MAPYPSQRPRAASEAPACSGERLEVIGPGRAADAAAFAASLARGLAERPKRLSCSWFYDEQGSRLFEEICELPEYYLTRAEREILETRAGEILGGLPARPALVELGSGSAAKTRVLIRALIERWGGLRYLPIDISSAMLEASSRRLLDEHPKLAITALGLPFEEALGRVADLVRGPRLVLWLGSSVGNLSRGEAAAFLSRVRAGLGPEDRFLLGVDLRKDKATLERAYDDARGVTARFNRNLLARANRELGAGFDLEAFAHRARYDEAEGRVEMHLESLRAQRVPVARLGREFEFAAGELVHTENSYKYSLAEIDALAAAAGFALEGQWLDRARRFSLSRLLPA